MNSASYEYRIEFANKRAQLVPTRLSAQTRVFQTQQEWCQLKFQAWLWSVFYDYILIKNEHKKKINIFRLIDNPQAFEKNGFDVYIHRNEWFPPHQFEFLKRCLIAHWLIVFNRDAKTNTFFSHFCYCLFSNPRV